MAERNMDQMGADELSTPELKLIQATGGDDAKTAGANPGDFYFPMSGEIIPGPEGVKFVLVDAVETRTYWGRSDIGNEPPECASSNARTMVALSGKDCRTCKERCEAPWALPAAERRTKCTTSYVILAIRADASTAPFMIRASGISCKSVKDLITTMRFNRQLVGHPEKAIVQVVASKQKTASGEAYAMVFKVIGMTPDDKVELFHNMSEQLLGAGTFTALPEGMSEPPGDDAPPPEEPPGEEEDAPPPAAVAVSHQPAQGKIPEKEYRRLPDTSETKKPAAPPPAPPKSTGLPKVDLDF